MRTLPITEELLQPLEDALQYQLLPAITGRQSLNDTERELLSLPARLGGLSIPVVTENANSHHSAWTTVMAPLVDLICHRQHAYDYPTHTQMEQRQRKTRIHTSNRSEALTTVNALKSKLPTPQQRGMEQASEKGVSSWLTTTPLSKYGINLHKQALRDALSLRYGWTPARLASHCPCGHPFNVSHALSCPKGAMPIMRHNGISDIIAQLLTEMCLNAGAEPVLQPLSGKRFHQCSTNMEDGARLDIRAQDLWDKSKRSTFFDVRVFNSHAPSNCMPSTKACYRRHEDEKRRTYEKRVIEVGKGTFTPLVLSSSGGCGPSATVALKRLAGLISEKNGQPYSSALAFIRYRHTFSLINSVVACLRTPRSAYHAPAMEISDNPLDLIRVLRPSCPTNWLTD